MGKNYEDNILGWDEIYNGLRVPPIPVETYKNSFALDASTIEDYFKGDASNAIISQESPREGPDDNKYTGYAPYTDLYATYISKNVRQPTLAGMTTRDYHAYPTYTIENILATFKGESTTSGVIVVHFELTTKMSYDILVDISISSSSVEIGTFSGGLSYDPQKSLEAGGKAVYLSPPLNVSYAEGTSITVVASLKYMDHPYHGINTKTISITPAVKSASYLYLNQSDFPNLLDLSGDTNGTMEVYDESNNLVTVTYSNMVAVTNNTDSSVDPIITTGSGNPFTVRTDLGYNIGNEDRNWEVLTTVNTTGSYQCYTPMVQATYILNHRGFLKSAGNKYESILVDKFPPMFNNKYVWVEVKSGSTVIAPLELFSVSTAYTASPGIVIPIKNIPSTGEYDYDFIVTIEDPFDANGDYIIGDYTSSDNFLNPKIINGNRPTHNTNQDYEFSGDIIGKSNTFTNLPSSYPYNAYDLLLFLDPLYEQQAINVYIRTKDGEVWEYENTVTNENGVWDQLINDNYKCQDIQVYLHRYNDINSLLYAGTITVGSHMPGTKYQVSRVVPNASHVIDAYGYNALVTFTLEPDTESSTAALPIAYDVSFIHYDDVNNRIVYQTSTKRIMADNVGKISTDVTVQCGYIVSIIYATVNDRGVSDWNKNYSKLFGYTRWCDSSSPPVGGAGKIWFDFNEKVGMQYLKSPVPSGPRLKCGDGSDVQSEKNLPGKVKGIRTFLVDDSYASRYGVVIKTGYELVVIEWDTALYADFYKVKYEYDVDGETVSVTTDAVDTEVGFAFYADHGTSLGKAITVTVEAFNRESDAGSVSDIYTCAVIAKLGEITSIAATATNPAGTKYLHFTWGAKTGATYQIAYGEPGERAYFSSTVANSFTLAIGTDLVNEKAFKIRYGKDGNGCSVWSSTYLVKVNGLTVTLESGDTFMTGSVDCQNTIPACSIEKSPIKIKLSSPTGLSATRLPNSKVRIEWNSVNQSIGYNLSYSLNGTWTSVYNHTSTSIDIDAGNSYDISVSVGALAEGDIFINSDSAKADFFVAPLKLSTPTGLSASGTNEHYFLNWNNTNLASQYEINYGPSTGNEHTTTSNYSNVQVSGEGLKIVFKVRALNASIPTSDWSGTFEYVGTIPAIEPVERKDMAATAEGGKIRYHWIFPAGCSTVDITIKDYYNSNEVTLTGLTSTSYLSNHDSSIYGGNMKIRAYSDVGGGISDSEYEFLGTLRDIRIAYADKKVSACSSNCVVEMEFVDEYGYDVYQFEWVSALQSGGAETDSGYLLNSTEEWHVYSLYISTYTGPSKIKVRGNFGAGKFSDWSDYEDIG